MKTLLRLSTLCTAFLLVPAAAQAQSFGDYLRSAASEAAARIVTNKAEEAVNKALTPSATPAAAPAGASPVDAPAPAPAPAQAAAPVPTGVPLPAAASSAAAPTPAASNCPRTRATPMPPLGARPATYEPASLWPDESPCPFYKVADWKFTAALAQKRAFNEASKVRCGDCEGGYAYDGWATHALVKGGGDIGGKFRDIMIGLKLGESVSWKGAKYVGSIKAVSANPIGETPCRQFHWTLKDKDKVIAEREGLYCEYKGDYMATAKWQEIL